jgi:flagellar biosynthesis/type III secretory pathway M-ring protein FliF/YscJ
MGYYDNILNLISVVLALAILFIILFGCQFKKYRYIERFSNEDAEKKEENKEETKEEKKEEPKEENKEELPELESRILDGLKNGSMTDAEMQDLIDKDIFKRENLEKMINYIDNAKK